MRSIRVGLVSLVVCAASAAHAQQRADAVLLVNSQSTRYADAQHYIRAYLDHFGVPYTVLDVATTPVGPDIGTYAVIIVGHASLDPAHVYLDATEEARLSSAVFQGTGLVNFDSDLTANGSTGRYRFVQDVFGFGYEPSTSVGDVRFSANAPSHFVSARHAANENVWTGWMNAATLVPPASATVLARFQTNSAPLVAVTTYGQGRAVQFASYQWMSLDVLGPMYALDDLVWRGVAWAARKPFVMQAMPHFLTMRVDDSNGWNNQTGTYRGFWWVPIANEFQIKPWLGVFYWDIRDADAAHLSSLVNGGLATASVHAKTSGDFFYFDHSNGRNLPDATVAANFQEANAWHQRWGIPVSKYVLGHFYETGSNVFAGLADWGVEYVVTHMAPGSPYANGVPWLNLQPFRLYDTRGANEGLPLHYADYLPVPGHPEYANRFFNCVTEIRDDAGYEWFPDNDVAGTIGRGTRQVKRAFDNMALGTLFTHEYYLQTISEANWRAELQGIMNNLASYSPIFVTMDYACQYLRARHDSKIVSSVFDPVTQSLTTDLSGRADIATQFVVFGGTGDAVTQSAVGVPAFTGSARVSGEISGPLHHIVVTPSPVSVAAGLTQRFSAQGYDASGNPLIGLGFTWSATAGGTIDQTGLFTAGTATGTFPGAVTASSGGVTGAADVTVFPQTVDRFTFAPLQTPIYEGQPFVAQITARDQAGNPVAAYAGHPQLSDLTGTLSPSITGDFVGGTWSGSLTIGRTATGNAITVADGAASGTSAAFDVLPAPTGLFTIWPSGSAPSTPDHGQDNPVELGVKFRSDVAGVVTGIRFYKAPTNTGTHVANLWTAGGALLATATFGSETASGWQQVNLPTPVTIVPNTIYVASYHTTVGHYAQDLNYFATAGYDSAPLHAVSTTEGGGNGCYAYGATSAFPASSYLATNYWVDVVFSAAPPAEPATVVVTPATAVLPTGGTQQFTAQAYDAQGTPISGHAFTWSTTGGGTVSASGLFTAGGAAGAFTGNVVATAGGVSGAASTEIVARTLHHFAFDPIAGPVYAGAPFPVRVTAIDQFGAVLAGYLGPAALADTTGTVSPPATGGFSAGSWSGTVAVANSAPAVTLTASDGAATGASAAFEVRASGPDLIETALSNPPASAPAGGSLSVTDTTTNAGNLAAAASTTRYYLGLAPTRGPADVLLSGERAVPSLAAGASSSGTVSVAIPAGTTAATYWLHACGDDLGAVTENSETNNCRAAATTLQVTGRPDLVETAVSSPPAAVLPGGTFSVTDTATNRGTGTAAASTTRHYLSTDAARNAGDVLLTGTRAVASLAAGGASTGTVTVTVPSATALGTYYLLACADDASAVAELDEANNCLASATTVRVARPDLAATAVSNPPASANTGTTFSVTDTTTNVGPLTAAASTTRYFLSADGLRDAGDVLLTGSRAVASLAAGAASSGTVTVTVPSATALGTYHLLACADYSAVVVEGDEANNCLAAATTVQVTRPDLVVTSGTAPPALIRAGAGFSFTGTTANRGTGSAGTSSTRYLLSLDAVRNTGDVLMSGTSSIPGLAAGASATVTTTITVPASTALGFYYVLACADYSSTVAESDETNNCLASAGTVEVTRPDLVPTSLTNPPASAAAGTSFSVTSSTQNQGRVAAGTTSTTRFYLSLDALRDAADVLMTGTRSVAALAAGATATGAATVTIPTGTAAATYYLLACSDDTARVAELDEANNCRASATQITTR